MSRLRIRSMCNTLVAASLILALLARLPLPDGLLLHDHSDHGVHSHTVTLDDLREDNFLEAWHRHHDENREDRNNDSDGSEWADPLLIFVNDPAPARGIHGSSGTVIASIQHLPSKVMPRSMLPSDRPDASRFLVSTWPSAHPLRPAFALDALLQSSHALLL